MRSYVQMSWILIGAADSAPLPEPVGEIVAVDVVTADVVEVGWGSDAFVQAANAMAAMTRPIEWRACRVE